MHSRGTGAGDSYGTAADLMKFDRALLSGRLVRREVLETFTVPRWPFPGPYIDERYGR